MLLVYNMCACGGGVRESEREREYVGREVLFSYRWWTEFTCGLTWNCCMVGYAMACGKAPLTPCVAPAGVSCAVGGTQVVPGIGIDVPILMNIEKIT